MSKIVLMYHDVLDGALKESGFMTPLAYDYKIAESLFEKHVKSCVGKNVLFTFDDGGVSNLLVAVPILEKYGFKGLFFITTSKIGCSGFLTKEQIKLLFDRGHIIGTHTHSHSAHLDRLSKEEIYNEWKKSVDILSSIIGQKIQVASVPNGNVSKAVYEEAFKCGIETIYTSIPQDADGTECIVGRYVIRNGFQVSILQKILNNRFYRFFLYFKYRVICVLKFLLGPFYIRLRLLFSH